METRMLEKNKLVTKEISKYFTKEYHYFIIDIFQYEDDNVKQLQILFTYAFSHKKHYFRKSIQKCKKFCKITYGT